MNVEQYIIPENTAASISARYTTHQYLDAVNHVQSVLIVY